MGEMTVRMPKSTTKEKKAPSKKANPTHNRVGLF